MSVRASYAEAIMTTDEAAEVLHISQRHLQWLIKTRQLQACKIGRRYRVRAKHLDAFLDAHEVIPTETST